MPILAMVQSGFYWVTAQRNFCGPIEFPAGGGSMAVAIGDLNKDGWPDIVTADANFTGVSFCITLPLRNQHQTLPSQRTHWL